MCVCVCKKSGMAMSQSVVDKNGMVKSGVQTMAVLKKSRLTIWRMGTMYVYLISVRRLCLA